ncbi:MAG TPA: hypothetical protein DIS79_06950 [Bacteroidetes bacterium]|nr:hypothetical protein [Bacteroidota bacterium]HRK04170.1 phosphoribosyltransferase family protein [Chlorobiota bacterium]
MRSIRAVTVRMVRTVTESILDVVFPRRCLVYGTPLDGREHLVGVSNAAFEEFLPAPSSAELLSLVYSHFDRDDVYIDNVFARWAVSPVSDVSAVIHAIKYQGRYKLAVALGRELGRAALFADCIPLQAESPIIIPIPIHAARRRERGYNQAEAISKGLAEITGLHVNVTTVRRVRWTGTQTALNSRERLQNIRSAFTIDDPHIIRNSTVILVDDVLTTGATTNACAECVLDAGARRVLVWTVAATV